MSTATGPRVLVVEFLPSGGMFQFSHALSAAMADEGADVTLLTGPDPEIRGDRPGLTVLELLPTWHPNAAAPRERGRTLLRRIGRAARLLDSWRRVVVLVRRTRPDVVQFGELRFLPDRLGLLAVRRAFAGVLVDVAHNPRPYDVTRGSGRGAARVEKADRLTTWSLEHAYAACDLVLALGDGPRAQLLEAFPGVRRTAVIGHGQYEEFRAVDPGPPSAAGQVLLFFGTWTRYKGLPLLLDAFALLRDTHPGARLVVAGAVMPDVDLAALQDEAARIGAVELRPGYVPLPELDRLFTSARAVVAPYSTVNVSGAVHMAYTFGRPVVATDVGSMSDVVQHGRTGLLCRPTPADLAAGLRRVLDDPAHADQLGAGARHSISAGGSWAEVARRSLAAYALAGAASASLVPRPTARPTEPPPELPARPSTATHLT